MTIAPPPDIPDQLAAPMSGPASGGDAVREYDRRAADLAGQYEAVAFEHVHADVLDLLPPEPSAILDVGAGSGRDAAWFAARGHEVVAVEPSCGMRGEAARRHGSPRIRWIDDRLPGLERVHRLGMAFDLVLLSAVWMHVAPADRRRAFRKLVTLLKPGGRMVVSLRHGPPDPSRPMHPVSRAEIERLAAEHGAVVTRASWAPDAGSRLDIRWETVAVQLADDGTGALPLIRHIVLNDAKASTYKLALLRVVARAADASPGLAVTDRDDSVALPLGLVALYWVRMFLPLVAADLPQTPTSRNGDNLGFVRDAFRWLAGTAPPELRVGAEFQGDMAAALDGAVRDAAVTITRMPAHYITFPGSARQVFGATLRRSPRAGGGLLLDAPYLWSVGEFRVPLHVWQALTRMNAWIEPALTAEWTRLMEQYLLRQDRQVPHDRIAGALAWLDPERSTLEVRRIVRAMMEAGDPVYCVWTRNRLRPGNFDVDHCLPFAAWPNGDLWNLMPANDRVQRHQKRDRLITADLLDRSADLIAEWWDRAYLRRGDVTAHRFGWEARASLPLAWSSESVGSGEVLDALSVKRLMLKVTQQLPEWDGPSRFIVDPGRG